MRDATSVKVSTVTAIAVTYINTYSRAFQVREALHIDNYPVPVASGKEDHAGLILLSVLVRYLHTAMWRKSNALSNALLLLQQNRSIRAPTSLFNKERVQFFLKVGNKMHKPCVFQKWPRARWCLRRARYRKQSAPPLRQQQCFQHQLSDNLYQPYWLSGDSGPQLHMAHLSTTQAGSPCTLLCYEGCAAVPLVPPPSIVLQLHRFCSIGIDFNTQFCALFEEGK